MRRSRPSRAGSRMATRRSFRLFGYAGTGKTTLAKYFADNVEGEVLFAAFYRQGGAGAARPRRQERPHHPFADLPAARRGGGLQRGDRQDHRLADVRHQPPEPAQPGGPDHHRRMLDGRRGAGQGPDELRHADPGLGRSRGNCRRSPAAAISPNTSPISCSPKSTARPATTRSSIWPCMCARAAEIMHGDYGTAQVIGKNEVDRDMVLEADQVLVGTNPHQAAIQPAPARAQGLRSGLPAGRRQAGVPEERSGQGPAQRLASGR